MDTTPSIPFRQRIGSRLGAAFGTVLLLMLVMAVLGALQLRAVAQLDERLESLSQRAQSMEQWKGATSVNLARALAIAHSGYQADVTAAFEPLMKKTSASISEVQKALEAALDDDEEKRLFAAVGDRRKAYVDIRAQAGKLFAAGQLEAGRTQVGSAMVPAADAYVAAMDAMLAHYQDRVRAANADVHAQVASGLRLLAAFALLGLACGAGFALAITRSITRPLAAAVDTADAIAGGDLTRRLQGGRADEIGRLLVALGRMQQGLSRTVLQIRAGTDGIGTASREVATGSQDLSARTEQTAANLQQTAAAMEQITQTVRQSTDAAAQANQLASGASGVARRGGEVVAQVVSTMDEISTASRKIADITGVIDGIAFQTNILALNAAVEAARAGEQGRGFAVVAGEVRTLAQRSAEAAREIKALIGGSVDRVEAGSRLVAEAGSTMQEIVASVQRVTDIIGEITAAASEQDRGMGQVNLAVSELDRMTQQNAALVEESAAAAASLQSQAQQLAVSVSTFRVDESVAA